MSHDIVRRPILNHNSRLTPHGRRLLVDRVHAGQPAAHVAKQMGISRTAAYRWVKRYTDEGPDGLRDRSSRPHSHQNATDPDQAAKVLNDRQEHREGPADISWRTGIPERTVSRIIARAGLPRIWEMDPMTGERIRAGRASERRYEREHPGELMHTDVKKLGRIPDGGGWRADPEQSRQNHKTGHGQV